MGKKQLSLIALMILMGYSISGTNLFAQQKTKNIFEDWKDIPPVITPASGDSAPSDATVLFNKNNLYQWERVKEKEKPIAWKVSDNVLTVEPGSGSIATKQSFGDCQLHIEWKNPANEVHQNLRYGNSGVLLMGFYEVQIYSSYNNEHKIYYNGQAGSIYKQYTPLVNACLPPDEWQTFDIIFIAPRFNSDKSLSSPAQFTVFHNGILIQYNVSLKGQTNDGDYSEYKWHPEKLPLVLQEHESRVSFRNIWIRNLNLIR